MPEFICLQPLVYNELCPTQILTWDTDYSIVSDVRMTSPGESHLNFDKVGELDS